MQITKPSVSTDVILTVRTFASAAHPAPCWPNVVFDLL